MQSKDLPDPSTDDAAESRTDAAPAPSDTERTLPGDGESTGADASQPVAPAEAAAEPQPEAVAEDQPEVVAEEPGAVAETQPVPAAAATSLTKPVPSAKPAPAAKSTAAKSQSVAGAGTRAPNRTRNLALVWVAVVLVIAGVVYGITSVAATSDPVAAPSPSAAASAPAETPPPTAAASAAPATGNLSSVSVTGTTNPALKVAVPFAVAKTSTRLLTPGKGKVITAGQRVTIDYLGVNGTSGKTFDTSYGKSPASFILGDKNLIKGMAVGLAGVNIGSRVLLAIPAVDGYGTTGAPDAGIGPTDTLLFLVDVKSAVTPPVPLARAAGAAVAPKAGLPTVAVDAKTGKPTLTVPKTAAPAALVVQPLITGKGATVAKGQQITVHYTGVIWASGKEFDSSWTRGEPATFGIGTGAVIPGWDKGLVGQKVGSQVLLVIPPADGYGANGSPDAGIAGTDTLVFVVDILATS